MIIQKDLCTIQRKNFSNVDKQLLEEEEKDVQKDNVFCD